MEKCEINYLNLLMKIWWFSIVLTTLLTLSEANHMAVEIFRQNDHPKSSKIIGGDYVQSGEYPWIVSIHEDNSHDCGGTILNEQWIITAAHCIHYPKDPKRYMIYAGLHRLSYTDYKRVKRRKISKIVIHHQYDGIDYKNDIALMKTRAPLGIKGSNGYISNIYLPASIKDPVGYATVSGWGHTVGDGKISDRLKSVRIPIVPRKTCNQAYDKDPNDNKDRILDTMFCAGSVNKDSCKGDSGGPLIQKNKKGQNILIGIVSWGRGCGINNYPGVYTKVAAYKDWILRNVD